MGSSKTRITGMYSGMDTESIISQLVEARKTKVDKTKKEQMTIEYKQNAWKDLNKKIKSLQNTLSNLQYSGSYSKRTTKISDPNVASIVTSDNAMISVQNLKVTSLAQSAYLSGNKIPYASGDEKATSGTLLSDLGISSSDSLTFTVGGESKTIEIKDDMTIGQLTNAMAEAGVNANFDSTTQRFFIGAKEGGSKGEFEISGSAIEKLGLDVDSASKQWVHGTDGKIELNGVEYESSNNTYEVNGLTITANALTTGDGVSLNTSKDTSAMYDMIKKFINQYTELVNEMDKLYNADTKTKYDPLTDEEKAAMSDFEIEKWEEKLKEQILAKDSNINSVTSALIEGVNKGFKVGEKTLFLFDFGIETESYMTAEENKKHALHIYGDADDEKFSTETNKLKYMIESDSETVTKFFSQLCNDLYTKMSDMSKSVDGYRSYGYFYDDKKMKSDYTDYTSKIADLEDKLQKYEDKWYDKFAKMETAMSKMQSNASAVMSLLGS